MTKTKRQIIEAVQQTKELPSFPDVVMRLEEEMNKPEPSVEKVAKIVQEDPPLSARFLQLANSAYYSRTRQTTSISQAVLRLGLSEARKIAVAAGVFSKLSGFGGRDTRQFWTHCLAVALATEIIIKRAPKKPPLELLDSAFAAGLLHDLGALALHQVIPDEYDALIEEAGQTGRSVHELEAERLEVTHEEIGEILTKRWGLPETISSAIHHHHFPAHAMSKVQPLAQLINVADAICVEQGFGRPESANPPVRDEDAWKAFGLNDAMSHNIIDRVRAMGGRAEILVDDFRFD